jgi:hypothetical protein
MQTHLQITTPDSYQEQFSKLAHAEAEICEFASSSHFQIAKFSNCQINRTFAAQNSRL